MTMLDTLRRRATAGGLRAALAAPASLRRRACGEPQRNDRGDTLDADVHLIAALHARLMPPLMGRDVAKSRRALARSYAAGSRPPPPTVTTSELQLAGRRVRLYRPPAGTTSTALLVYLHGGGWVLGDLECYDGLCGRLCADVGVYVASVDYRLAPEHPFPAGFDDALAAVEAARGLAPSLGVAADRVGVGGDSAGGNLSAAVCVAARDRGLPLPAFQLLLYPALDASRSAPSHTVFAGGPFLRRRDVDRFIAHYAAPDLLDVRVSPGLVADASGLPPALITTAGFDVLRDEGEAYVAKLRAAGVAVRHLHHPTLTHGYATLDGAAVAADAAVAALCAELRALAAA